MARGTALTMAATIWFLAGTQPGAAQPERFEGKQIRNIQFDPADQPLEGAEIHRILPLRIGQPLHLIDVREAIYRLYATGQYTDIRVDAKLSGDEVILTIYTQHSWFIGRVSADKRVKQPPNTGQLVNATGLRLGQAYRPVYHRLSLCHRFAESTAAIADV